MLKDVIRRHGELGGGGASLLLGNELLLLRVLGAGDDANGLLRGVAVCLVLAKGVVYALLLVEDVVDIDCF